MAKTKIEWADSTWNPITGCTKISEGCKNCYAERMAKRLAGRVGYPKEDPFKVTLHRDKLTQKGSPLSMRKGKRIFVCSMGDLFHEDVKDEWLDQIFDIMRRANWHFYFILTKRPDRMVLYLESIRERARKSPWRLFPNVAFGVTIESNETYELRRTHLFCLSLLGVNNIFLSLEPLLEEITIDLNPNVNNIYSWVIAGCETGPGRRKSEFGWFENLIISCHKYNIPLFVKQVEMNGDIVKEPFKDFLQFPEYAKPNRHCQWRKTNE